MSMNAESHQLELVEVENLLQLELKEGGNFTDFLSLSPLTDQEREEIRGISRQFRRYLGWGKISEGMIKFLVISPLLRLAGFFDLPVVLTLEKSINIDIEDQETVIRGKLDILAMQYSDASLTATPFWLLVVETKNSKIDALEGLAQLLTYAYKGLDKQDRVLGLTTNGISYRFVVLENGTPTTYQILPELNLIDLDRSEQLLQVLKGICQLQAVQSLALVTDL
jgi:hypothetical protein